MESIHPTPAPRFVDMRAVAVHLSVSPRTVQNWTYAGRLPHVRISPRCIRYDLAAIDSAIHRAASFTGRAA